MALSEKDIHIGKFFQQSKSRAQNKNIPFTVTLKYLRDTAVDYCPVFGHKFVWGRSRLGKGKTTGDSPSLDRIIPELGYVPGNVVFISHNANRIKNNATEKELYAVADWLHEARKNVKQNTATPIPAGHYSKSTEHTKHGTVLATGIRQDGNDFNHHSGAVHRQDIDHSPQASSGDSVGHGGQEVGTSETPQGVKDYGKFNTATHWPFYRSRRIPDKP